MKTHSLPLSQEHNLIFHLMINSLASSVQRRESVQVKKEWLLQLSPYNTPAVVGHTFVDAVRKKNRPETSSARLFAAAASLHLLARFDEFSARI